MTGRFAIYAAPGARRPDPARGALRERAEQWLGRSVPPDPVHARSPAGWTRAAVDAITVDARRYGFHATLKAPFRLAEGRTPEELDAAVAGSRPTAPRVVIPRLSLARLGGFFALVPGAEATEPARARRRGGAGFDDFRAPATEAELARRNPASLTPRQRELLERLGLPVRAR